ncbi:MAG: Phenylalanine-tRNA ligase alpha subunit [Candidatus Woesebacteria bacterium GW2011_GWB1_45_5]|uniref:Phenylalanine--tRNA ligase alpha subunit n=1 Tax=Candidatus Woesebacteria bacterium GW2011_GWB1_45_5 TaxID=1618581 RepID=A0A0G1MN92_9BACT|nr:MAG: Phenylalanine-tRNA ligase alpha subunit [Candidatus Woesebacteria bacterium GW2011_GWB1_45_5]
MFASPPKTGGFFVVELISMQEEIINTKNQAIAQIGSAESVKELEEVRTSYLGRNGRFTILVKKIKEVPAEKRREFGITLNESKNALENLLSDKKQELIKSLTEKREWFDVSVPGVKPALGHLHPLTQVLTDVKKVFNYLGYQVADGPEIETDYYNFEALNIPKDHPARDTQMTFYTNTGNILRTQTSAMQGRVMEKMKPPFRVLVPGRNFRYEQVDASHGFEFWQVEGFVVDENIHLTDLFGTIDHVLKELFGREVGLRFATTNFPFVEPGVDTYMRCTICGGKGCSFCKNSGWSEIMPAGMIHPNVLKTARIDTKKWNGFAFAIGLSRIVNLRYQINDLRTLTTPDLRILNQF